MSKSMSAALVCAALALTACGGNEDEAEVTTAEDTNLDAGVGGADMSATLEGQGDMSSAAGAGAATAAMDGGEAGDDGEPPAGQGEGGPADALTSDE